MIVPVILAGGSGSRLWPLSRELYPKQFLTLHGTQSMLHATLQRLNGMALATPWVVCNEEHRFLVAEQLRQAEQLNHNILLEPVGKNTAPALAVTAHYFRQQGQDPLLLVLAADHVIQDIAAFQSSMQAAIPFAANGKLVTFGVKPSSAETGYGYIQQGAAVTPEAQAFAVTAFKEKPDQSTAEQYLQSGDYFWNSGIFLLRASDYLRNLAEYRPDIEQACARCVAGLSSDMDFIRIDRDAFLACPAESIDYAVMEKTRDALMVPLGSDWSDVGSWSALWVLSDKDAQGNVHRGDVISIDSHDNYIYAESGLVATVGLHNITIVQTKDAVLVAPHDQVQQVRQVVDQLKQSGRSEHRVHREVYRPWGKFDAIDQGERYQVKHITVLAGEKLSSQMHHHRAEHWIVVSGTAKVSIDGRTQLLAENESVYIPLGATHSLENPGKIPLELIEVQSGSYLGEDDIVRFEDRYGRSG